jgi:hypothetical protein
MYNSQIIEALNAHSQQKSQEKPQQHRVQREGSLQIQCVSWFRYQYKSFTKLLIHPRNEAGGKNSRKVAIDAAAGVCLVFPISCCCFQPSSISEKSLTCISVSALS